MNITYENIEQLNACVNATEERQKALTAEYEALRNAKTQLRKKSLELLTDIVKQWLHTMPNAISLEITARVEYEYNDQGGTDTFLRFAYNVVPIDASVSNDDEDACGDDDIDNVLIDLLYDSFTIDEIEACEDETLTYIINK